MVRELYGSAASFALFLHLLWLGFVIFGAFFTARRPRLAALHVAALLWGIAVELGPWPCPLTALEQYLQTKAGIRAYTNSFLAHYLDAIVYPDIPGQVLAVIATAVCVINLGVYGSRGQ